MGSTSMWKKMKNVIAKIKLLDTTDTTIEKHFADKFSF